MLNKTILIKMFLSIFVLSLTSTILHHNTYATTVTLYPTDDTMVTSIEENNTFGTYDILELGYDTTAFPGWAYFALLKFDTSKIPEKATINKATFNFYYLPPLKTTEKMPSYQVQRAMSDWNEETVNYKNKPNRDSGVYISAFSNTVGYKEWDLTTLVSKWVNKTYNNYGFYVVPTDWVYWISRFYSKEGTQKPTLVIDYTAPESNLLIPTINLPKIEIPKTIEPTVVIKDLFPPIISDVKVINTGISTAKVTWATDENSTSYVDYGDTSVYTKHKGQSDSAKQHEVLIDGLLIFKTYHFTVRSTDIYGNEGKTSDAKFFQFYKIPSPGGLVPLLPADDTSEDNYIDPNQPVDVDQPDVPNQQPPQDQPSSQDDSTSTDNNTGGSNIVFETIDEDKNQENSNKEKGINITEKGKQTGEQTTETEGISKGSIQITLTPAVLIAIMAGLILAALVVLFLIIRSIKKSKKSGGTQEPEAIEEENKELEEKH